MVETPLAAPWVSVVYLFSIAYTHGKYLPVMLLAIVSLASLNRRSGADPAYRGLVRPGNREDFRRRIGRRRATRGEGFHHPYLNCNQKEKE